MAHGPLEYLDQMGMDEVLALVRALARDFGDRVPWSPVFEKMVEHGWLGAKSGLGFYRHGKSRRKPNAHISQVLEPAIAQRAGDAILTGKEQIAHIRDRLIPLVVNEAARCLEEGGYDAAKIDLAMVLAGAWPPHRGGPLRYAQDQGLPELLATLKKLSATHGPRYEPCALLQRLAQGEAPPLFAD
jgi:3-hydroxyacyl-CoA dehydrogenase